MVQIALAVPVVTATAFDQTRYLRYLPGQNIKGYVEYASIKLLHAPIREPGKKGCLLRAVSRKDAKEAKAQRLAWIEIRIIYYKSNS